MGNRLLLEIEKTNHIFHIDTCLLSGIAEDTMTPLNKWRAAKLIVWQPGAAYLLRKTPYIAIGTFEVRGLRMLHLCIGPKQEM